MKGLIIKDFYCIRTSVKSVVLICIFSFFICIMAVISMQYGNLALAFENIREYGMDSRSAMALWKILLSALIFLPMALTWDVTRCFSEDQRCGFGKHEASFPISAFRTVTARYSAVMLFGSSLFLFTTFLALLCGLLSPDFTPGELIRRNAVLAGIIMTVVITIFFFIYITDGRYMEWIMAVPVLTALFIFFRTLLALEEFNFETILQWLDSCFCLPFFILLAAISLCAYTGSLFLVSKKRGIR